MAIVVALGVLVPVLVTNAADAQGEFDRRRIPLDFQVDRLAFHPNGESLLLISNERQGVFLLDLASGSIEAQYMYRSWQFSVSDTAADPRGKYAYLIGQDFNGAGILARVDYDTMQGSEIRFSTKTLRPSIAVIDDGRI